MGWEIQRNRPSVMDEVIAYFRIQLVCVQIKIGLKPAKFQSNFYSLFLSPHSHIPSKMGIKDFPRSVRLYSTFGGIWGYSFL